MENSERKLFSVEGKPLESMLILIESFENEESDKEQYQRASRDLRSFLTENFENEDELNTALVLLKI